MATDLLARTLLLEEAVSPAAVAEALFASVNGGVSLPQALIDAGVAGHETLERLLARSEAPVLRQLVPVDALVDRLPAGLPARLLAVPVRLDPVTGTVDLATADPEDPHPAAEVAYHLGAPVRVVRAPLSAIEEALRRLRMRTHDDRPADRFQEAARHAERERAASTAPPPAPARARQRLVIEPDSAPPPHAAALSRVRTPPWGTPLRTAPLEPPRAEPPSSDPSSDIPIPLTRRTVMPARPRTGRPPPDAREGFSLGEGYAIDTTGLREVVERSRIEMPPISPLGSFIPGPPPLPGITARDLAFPDVGSVLAALRNAGSRDEVLELVLSGARVYATKVALFVVKRGGYHGWAASPEFGTRSEIANVVVPLEADSIFDHAIREDVYLGPVDGIDAHASLLRIMREPSRDVAAIPIRVSGKTASIIVADDLTDTMTATRRLEEIAKAAGDAFTRIVRARR